MALPLVKAAAINGLRAYFVVKKTTTKATIQGFLSRAKLHFPCVGYIPTSQVLSRLQEGRLALSFLPPEGPLPRCGILTNTPPVQFARIAASCACNHNTAMSLSLTSQASRDTSVMEFPSVEEQIERRREVLLIIVDVSFWSGHDLVLYYSESPSRRGAP